MHMLIGVATSPTRIIAIGTVVFGLLKLLKQFVPGIDGKYAFAVNIAFTLLGVIVTTDPTQLFTMHTFNAMVDTVFVAAGIHGTAKRLWVDGPEQPSVTPPSGAAVSRLNAMTAAMAALLLTSVMFGCAHQVTAAPAPALPPNAVNQTDFEANRTLQAAHAFAEAATDSMRQNPDVITTNERAAFLALNRALNIADPLEQSYHNSGGRLNGDALAKAIAQVLAAFAAAQQSIAPSVQ